jgi:menaquinone-dependent protoporphyrinogen oxidase
VRPTGVVLAGRRGLPRIPGDGGTGIGSEGADAMKVLVAYASRHGATRGIAERIADTLQAAGLDARARPVDAASDVEDYDACVIGSAAYMFHWLKEAASFVRRNRAVLSSMPVWMFSSGPLGTEPVNPKGEDQKAAAIPRELPELVQLIGAREYRVFFGAYSHDRKPIGFGERFMSLMPATRDSLPEGDFRDWQEIEAWARDIARNLSPVTVG